MAQKSMKFSPDNYLDDGRGLAFLKRRRIQSGLALGVITTLAVISAILLNFNVLTVFANIPKAAGRFIELYLPPTFDDGAKLIEAIWVTLLLSISAAVVGSFIALLMALGMSQRTGHIKGLKVGLRFLATFLRNVPPTIWAIILLMAFWFGEFLAFIVMVIATIGFNARLYSDLIDETNSKSIEALQSSGANYWQIIANAVLPETMPGLISWTLYAVETNIRSATIIGMLAGGGIGYLIGIFKHHRHFTELTGAVLLLVVLIMGFDQLSMYIRKRIL